MSDYEALRGVMRSRDALQDVANKAQERLEKMEQEFRARLREQEAIVEEAEKMHRDYVGASLRWERSPNRSSPPGSTYTIKKKMGVYTKNRGTLIPIHYPWLRTSPAPAPAPAPVPAPAPAPAPESETEDLFGDLHDEARPPPAPAPKRRKPRVIDDDTSSEEDEVAAEDDGEEPGILEQLMALFKENHGRDPTEAEVQQWRDTLREAAEEADAGVQPAAPKEDNTPRGKAPEPVAQVSVEPAAKKQRVAEA